jgi:AcrR family transcriptional regulator
MRSAQTAALELRTDHWQMISSAAGALAAYQLSERGPLLRTSALGALPAQMRLTMVEHFNRVSERFAAMISDGVAEGTIRAVDPYIAAQMLNATLNGASDLRFVIPELKPNDLVDLYARPLLMGMFSR